jgi:hypothetical protein
MKRIATIFFLLVLLASFAGAATIQKFPGSPFLYDSTTGKMVGIKESDGTESLFANWIASNLSITGQAAGDILYFNGTQWTRLAKDAGKYLKSGASAVSWDTPAAGGAGGVTSEAGTYAAGSLVVYKDNTGDVIGVPSLLSGIVKSTSGVIGEAAASDVVGLFGSGSCSGYLKSDGTCDSPQAQSDILDGIAGVTPANNGIFGYNNSGELGLYTNHSHDDSAAQFYSATASKGTFKMLMTSMGDGIAGTFTPVCTGACTLTTESYGAGTYTLVDKTSTQTLTNKTLTSPTLTTPIITSLEVLIDCNGEADPYAYCTSANASTLTATQTSRTIINSYGRGEAQTVTLPAAATGMTFIAMVGTQHNSAWKIQRAGSDTITWSSGGTDTTGKTYFQETNQAVGSRVSCITYKTGASAWTWLCGSVTGTWVTD